VAWALHTRAFSDKSIVRLGDAKTGSDLAYLKIFTGNKESRAFYETEITNRTKVQESLNVSGSSRVRVPQSYGTLQIGITAYHLEAASRGTQISAMVRELGYFENAKRVERDFAQICDPSSSSLRPCRTYPACGQSRQPGARFLKPFAAIPT
jgi:hypothetical protein